MAGTVYAMCGIAFSGKSTAARSIARELGLALISLDAINTERGLDGGKGIPDAEWEQTSFIAMSRLHEMLDAKRSVVVDDTFSHRFLRDRCSRVAKDHGCRFVILFMDTRLDVIEARRRANTSNPVRGPIDDAVFEHHRARFQFPTDDEPVVRLKDEGDVAAWIERERQLNR